MAFETLLYEKKDRIGYVTLNRPERANSFNNTMSFELQKLWAEIRDDDDVWVVVLTGAGDRYFCTGADMKDTAARAGYEKDFSPGLRPLPDMWKPVILAINGVCAGGGFHFVTFVSDFAICSENATFMEPHVSVAQVPVREGLGLATRIPLSVVMRLVMSGTKERLTAQDAFRYGLVTEVVPQEKLLPRATEIAENILEQSPLTVRAIKEIMARNFYCEYALGNAQTLGDYVRKLHDRCEDHLEGPRAFAQKRKPDCKAR